MGAGDGDDGDGGGGDVARNGDKTTGASVVAGLVGVAWSAIFNLSNVGCRKGKESGKENIGCILWAR